MATRTGTTPRKRTSSTALRAGEAPPVAVNDDDDDNDDAETTSSLPLIGSRRTAAIATPAATATAPTSTSQPTLLLALVALIAIALTLAGRRPPIETQPQPLPQQPPERFSCPLAPSPSARDAARLAFARNLTRSRPWLLRPLPNAPRDAQDLFSAGLLEAQGFNAAEAAEFADLALQQSAPGCALCAWLGAYSLGPSPNVVADARGSRGAGFPVFGPEEAAQADALAQRALAMALEEDQKENSSRSDLRLIRALADRNRGAAALVARATSGEPLPEPWRARQEAYARELAALAAEVEVEEEEGQEDDEAAAAPPQQGLSRADVLALAAEAHLCLTPWDYYYYDEGSGEEKAPSHPPPRRLLLPGDFWTTRSSSSSSSSNDSAAVPRPTRRMRLRPTAAAAERLLRSALRLDPRHPLALHLLVHVAEAGTPGPRPRPSEKQDQNNHAAADEEKVVAWRGEAAADALAALALPQGHLLHMPSHVYVRVGRYRDAVRSNAAARRHDVSTAARQRCAPAYVPEHNAQLASYAAAAGGMERAALASALGARRLRASLPDLYVARGTEWTTVPLLRARFGDWRAVLLPEAPRSGVVRAADADGEDDARGDDDQKPDPDFERGPLRPPPPDARARTLAGGQGFSRVVYHYVRLLALAARADAERGGAGSSSLEVARELRALRRAAADRRALSEPRTLPGGFPGLYASGNVRLAPIYERIGTARAEMLQASRWRGEVDDKETAPKGWRRRKQHQRRRRQRQRLADAADRRALAALREAVELERALPYLEPPMLEAPASACLGWFLLERGGGGKGASAEEAEEEAARVYRRELAERHAENPWALAGLLRALERKGDHDEAELADVRGRAERAWRDADADVRARFGPDAASASSSSSSSCPQLSAPWAAAAGD